VDTKTLFDLANEAGIKLTDEDGYHDARQVWIDGYMASPEWLMDIWIDALAEMKDPEALLKYFGSTHKENEISDAHKRENISLKMTLAASLTVQLSFLGAQTYKTVLTFVEQYVDSECENWWTDCMNYYSDMQQGMAEDNAYENYRDRKLEERS
jgi:hypothetical protein